MEEEHRIERSDSNELVSSLLVEMTIEEKVAQLGSVLPGELTTSGEFSENKARSVLGNGIGHITKPGGESGRSPEDTAKLINRIQDFLQEETRLGIPAMIHEESLSGYMGKGGKSYPQMIGLASSWDPDLVKRMTSSIKKKIRALGGHQVLSPVLDVARDLRWGRVEETFGEDPYLVATMGKKYIQGLQGKGPSKGLFATGKHFGGHSIPEGGRNHSPVNVSQRELRENFLFPFEAAIKEVGIEAVMSAYHDIDGVPCSCSEELLTDTLREEWGFDGFVISDGHSIKMLNTEHAVARNDREAGYMALKAGVDLEGPTTECFGDEMVTAIREGDLPEELVDRAVRRNLKSKREKGLFSGKLKFKLDEVEKYFDRPSNDNLARNAGRESIVLLKNENDLLPLSRKLDSIAIIGPNADNKRNLLGDYAFGGHYDEEENGNEVITLLEGVQEKVSPTTTLDFVKGCEIQGSSQRNFEEALKAIKEKDVAIVAVGGKSGFGVFPPEGREQNFGQTTGEGNDRTTLQLPRVQQKLLREINETSTPVVAVLVNGRPLAIQWTKNHIPAIVEAWLPGESGGKAIADILFGDYNPSGKLPVTIPKNVGQCPMYYRRKTISKGRSYVFTENEPLYPFGFGLSYTSFEYRDLRIVPEKVEPSDEVKVSCKVRNNGKMKGEEIIQLYLRDEFASITRPERELKGFEKVNLEPGEEKRVGFYIPTDLLAFYDRKMELLVEPGNFRVMVGSSSTDIKLTGEFEVIGSKRKIKSDRTFFSKSLID